MIVVATVNVPAVLVTVSVSRRVDVTCAVSDEAEVISVVTVLVTTVVSVSVLVILVTVCARPGGKSEPIATVQLMTTSTVSNALCG